jgi:hypothetical protein
MRKLVVAVLVGSILFTLPFLISAEEFSSANFKIKDPVISIGGGLVTSTNFLLQGSIGQPAPGTSTAASFELRAGFLFFPAPVAPAVPSPTPPILGVRPGRSFLRITPLIPLRITPLIPRCVRFGDLNCDGKVNLTDLSIFLYFLNQPWQIASRYDINEDGVLDLRDISIMFYYWTTA